MPDKTPINIAIIPARGGSKRIPGKNIKPFLGKPLILYSVEAALKSGAFDKIVVSTDDRQIADIAREHGAEVPFIRPSSLADDFATTADVIEHAIIQCEKLYSSKIPRACCIYPTAPFIRHTDIADGLETLVGTNAGSVFTVTTFPYPIFRALKLDTTDCLSMFWPKYERTRSNDLQEAYHDAGQFYWINTGEFLKHKQIFGHNARPIVLPRILVQDIDTPEDWEAAEILYQLCKRKGIL